MMTSLPLSRQVALERLVPALLTAQAAVAPSDAAAPAPAPASAAAASAACASLLEEYEKLDSACVRSFWGPREHEAFRVRQAARAAAEEEKKRAAAEEERRRALAAAAEAAALEDKKRMALSIMRPWQLWRMTPCAGDCVTLEVSGGSRPGALLAAAPSGKALCLTSSKGDALAHWRLISRGGSLHFIETARAHTAGTTLDGWDPAALQRSVLSATGRGSLELFGVRDGSARQGWLVEKEGESGLVRLRCGLALEDGRQYLSVGYGAALLLWGALDAERDPLPLWRAPGAPAPGVGWHGALLTFQARSGAFLASAGSVLALQPQAALWRVQRVHILASGSQCYTIALDGEGARRFLTKVRELQIGEPFHAELDREFKGEDFIGGRQCWIIEAGAEGLVSLRALSQSYSSTVKLPRRPAFLTSQGAAGHLNLGKLDADSQWAFAAPSQLPAHALHDWNRTPGMRFIPGQRQQHFSEEDVKRREYSDRAKFREAVGFDGASPVVALAPGLAQGSSYLGIMYTRGRNMEDSEQLCYSRVMTWPEGVGENRFPSRPDTDLAALSAKCKVVCDFLAPISRGVLVRLPESLGKYWIKCMLNLPSLLHPALSNFPDTCTHATQGPFAPQIGMRKWYWST